MDVLSNVNSVRVKIVSVLKFSDYQLHKVFPMVVAEMGRRVPSRQCSSNPCLFRFLTC